MYALASFHLDCALVECLAYAINVSATLFRQSDREIPIVYGLAAKAAINQCIVVAYVFVEQIPLEEIILPFQ